MMINRFGMFKQGSETAEQNDGTDAEGFACLRISLSYVKRYLFPRSFDEYWCPLNPQ